MAAARVGLERREPGVRDVPPKRSSAAPIVKPFPADHQARDHAGRRRERRDRPWMPNFGNVTLTLSIRTSSWFAGPFGS